MAFHSLVKRVDCEKVWELSFSTILPSKKHILCHKQIHSSAYRGRCLDCQLYIDCTIQFRQGAKLLYGVLATIPALIEIRLPSLDFVMFHQAFYTGTPWMWM